MAAFSRSVIIRIANWSYASAKIRKQCRTPTPMASSTLHTGSIRWWLNAIPCAIHPVMLNKLTCQAVQYCDCEMEDCPNRVAQRPRQIHIEVFKTRRCGWGVRTTVDVEKGQVLGVYTGKLIRRAEAEQLTGLAKEYCFDLDYNEGGASIESLYSVDALKCGNWTRFINHSCAPNVRVQPVVYDTMPAQKIAFLAFIATQFIPARTEFTFDYDPEAQRAFETARSASDGKRRSSSKSQPPRPSEATDCVCGAELCRGWVRTT
ncbi:hypothetical protein B0H11DRAFT_1133593 [Mycena galericulata]|nr:hypothetical protein B0H11DRAFT_1133593 [Mycena galericulata]